jgi:glycosyltransferase involved in cell wall biosynthesis
MHPRRRRPTDSNLDGDTPVPDLTETGLLTSGVRRMSTMWVWTPRWLAEVDFYRPRRLGGPRDIIRLFRMARRHDHVILLGAVTVRHRYRDLILALLLKTLPRRRRPRVFIADATWQAQSRSLGRLTRLDPSVFGWPIRLVIKLIDGPEVNYGVLSREEAETFPSRWGVSPTRVVFTPFFATLDPTTPFSAGEHVFCGGDSLRDYDTLEKAVEGIDVPVTVAASWRPHGPSPTIDARYLPQEDYDRALATARMVVVPLRPAGRSAGQQTYLNAMLMAKPTIVSDTTGVRDYVEDGVTGVVVPPEDSAALRRAIEHVLDPANREMYEEMGRRARQTVLDSQLYPDYWDTVLLGAVDAQD